jgi:hypothetical protein
MDKQNGVGVLRSGEQIPTEDGDVETKPTYGSETPPTTARFSSRQGGEKYGGREGRREKIQ